MEIQKVKFMFKILLAISTLFNSIQVVETNMHSKPEIESHISAQTSFSDEVNILLEFEDLLYIETLFLETDDQPEIAERNFENSEFIHSTPNKNSAAVIESGLNLEPFRCYFINSEKMPLVISPIDPNISLESFYIGIENHKDEIKSLVSEYGALLLRDFPIQTAQEFSSTVKMTLGKPVDYKGEGSRTKVADGVYTSTEAPPSFYIPLHNELSCTNSPSSYFCFYCEIAPAPGIGQTILGKTEEITQAFKNLPQVWHLFENKNMNYISRHPSRGSIFTKLNKAHKTWQDAFETEDKNEVERICHENGFEFHWTGDWLEVIRTVPAIRNPDRHFNFPYWFNQVHLYHSNPRLYGGWKNYLLANLVYARHYTRPYDIEFEDGSPIPREIIYQIYDTLDAHTIKFDWQKQDVLLLDNIKAWHGKAPYKGPRRILASYVP